MPGGRPRKFATFAEAKKEDNRQQYLRRRQQVVRPEFIAYDPQIAVDYPTTTPTHIGLRISPDIPIPKDLTGLLDDEPQDNHTTDRASALIPTHNHDPEIAEQIRLAQENEREWNKEQAEYEAALADQIEERVTRTAEGIIEMQLCAASIDTTADTAAAGALEAVSLLDEDDLLAVGNSNDLEARRSPIVVTPKATVETVCNVPAPRQRRLTSSSHSSGRSSRNKSALPAQTNTLLGWLQPVALRPSGPRVLPPPAEQRLLNTNLSDYPTRMSANSTPITGTAAPRVVSRAGSLIPEPHENTATKLAKQLRLDCQSAFEGTSPAACPEDAGTPDENLPRNLCLSQHHYSSAKDRAANTTFDVDSLCCFPSSLGIACQGINWFPQSHAFLNFSQDVHFSLNVPAYNSRGDLKERRLPLHKIPHYCIGTAVGMDSLSLFVFFPKLHMDSSYEHSTYLSTEDQQLWYDAVLFPALTKTLGDSNLAQHYPVSAQVASLDAAALAAESFARKEVAREQLLKYVLQPQYLADLSFRTTTPPPPEFPTSIEIVNRRTINNLVTAAEPHRHKGALELKSARESHTTAILYSPRKIRNARARRLEKDRKNEEEQLEKLRMKDLSAEAKLITQERTRIAREERVKEKERRA
ncbi:hypothetical protein CC86DRAFT_432698 [Ophiobolus disseminans]|uniref:Uncharacterized protein n=1 Tax=Ophiobolus disseminans TaxID=1469910 RepID=A0A6A6ZFF9_9PLEO|nr:hypothetical protein CC86DRAFT_432698 [Ophiobolus disseminans]